LLLTVVGIGLVLCSTGSAEEPVPTDPFWSLVHDQAVLDDLKLTPEQRKELRGILDPLDLQCFPLRNKPAAEAPAGFARASSDVRKQLPSILRPAQMQRLEQIVVRCQGPAALLRDDLAAALKLTEKQRTGVKQAIADARSGRAKLERELRAAK